MVKKEYSPAKAEGILFGEEIATANPHGSLRPGNGNGDKNHEHTGEPGQTGEHPFKGD